MIARSLLLLLVCTITVNVVSAAMQDPPEEVRTVSIDVGDLVLHAKLYPGTGDDARPAVVLLHGWTWPQNDPSRGLVSAALEFQQAGYTVLVPSMRGWPPSGGADDCAGEQVQDVLRALAWLGQRDKVDDSKLFLAGYSQGGQVALLAASYKAPVRAVTAFAPVVDPGSWRKETVVAGIRDYVMEECGGPIGWPKRSVMNRVESIAAPVLLVHGDADRRVPPSQSTRLYHRLVERGLPVQLDLLSGIDHEQDDVLRPRMAIEYFKNFLE